MFVDIFNTENKYNVIYADPPWPYNEGGTNSKVKDRHYKMMQLEDICNLPIINLKDSQSILFLWVTSSKFPLAFDVMKAWGFQYYNVGFDWLKVSKSGVPIINPGYYTRQNNEFCLIGVPKNKKHRMKPLVHDVRCAVVEPRREHSRKPNIVRDEISRLFGNANRIELFARHKFQGWDCWGNEVS